MLSKISRLHAESLDARFQPRGKHDHFINLAEGVLAQLDFENATASLNKAGERNLARIKVIGAQSVHRAMAYSYGLRKPISLQTAQFKGLATNENWKHACTEFQLLNGFYNDRQQILGDECDRFSLLLWTQKAPCESCSEVVSQFLHHFSNARMLIYHDWKDRLSGSRASWLELGSRITIQRKRSAFNAR